MLTSSRSRLRWQHLLNLVVMICVFGFAVFILSYGFGVASPTVGIEHTESSGSATRPLDVLQVQAPIRKSYEGTSCQRVIVQHNFAASYGTPFVGGHLLYFRQLHRPLMKNRNILTPKEL
jgi:TRAP-type C4-dicarboxylate transport system permease small subunit